MNIVTVDLLVGPKIDRRALQPIRVKSGQMVAFDVGVEGEPPPTVTWQFNGSNLKSAGRFKIENPDYQTKFQMRNSERSDSGTYIIRAVNENGEDEASVKVVILGNNFFDYNYFELFVDR